MKSKKKLSIIRIPIITFLLGLIGFILSFTLTKNYQYNSEIFGFGIAFMGVGIAWFIVNIWRDKK